MSFIKSMQIYIKGKLHSQSYISSELVTLLFVHGIFLLGVGLSNTFINIFLWKENQSLKIVIMYNLLQFATTPLFFMLAGWLAKKVTLTATLRIGIICYSILFIVLLLLQSEASKYVWLLGILMGISCGFYYMSYNVLGYDFSSDQNRDFVMGIQGLVVSFATMVAPFAAGVIIQYLSGNKGYITVFSLSLILFIIAAVLSFRIPNKRIDKHYYLKSILFMPFRKKNWALVMAGESLRGFREGVMAFLTNILLYAIVNSEMVLGSYTLIVSGIQLFSFYVIAGRMKPYTRKGYMMVGAIALALVSSVFMLKINVVTLFIYGIISSFFITFINNPTASIIYWVIHKTPNSAKRRIEGIAVREVYLNLGRVAGVSLLLLISENIQVIPVIIFILGLSQLLMWYLFNKVQMEQSLVE